MRGMMRGMGMRGKRRGGICSRRGWRGSIGLLFCLGGVFFGYFMVVLVE